MARMEHDIGELRHRITVQDEVRTADGYGGFTITWATFAKLWARVEPVSGNEALVAKQLQDTITHIIVIRYRAGVKAAQRILFGTRVFNIREVKNFDERNWKMILRAEEGVAA